MMGMHGTAYANFAVQQANCIVKVGDGGVIHVDIRREVIGLVIQPDVGMQADVGAVVDRLMPLIKTPEQLPTHLAVERDMWLRKVAELKASHPLGYKALPDGRIKTQQAIESINRVMNKLNLMDNSFFTTGVGNHQMMAAQFIDWTKPRQCVTSGSLGTMGVGLPFAIGAQVANPDSTVILIDGDGSFNMTCGELQTAARYNLPVKIAVMNDARQQMV